MPYIQRKRNRLRHFDYSSDGCYFVTICCEQRRCLFGEIAENAGEVVLSDYGKVIEEEFRRISSVYEGVRITDHVIMPNHVHLIIETDGQTRSLSEIVNRIKGDIVRRTEAGLWQKSYYDHVIRDERDEIRIRQYIKLNPKKWAVDKYHPREGPKAQDTPKAEGVDG